MVYIIVRFGTIPMVHGEVALNRKFSGENRSDALSSGRVQTQEV